MAPRSTSEFYIGYQKRTPPGLSRFYRVLILAWLIGVGALATLLVPRQAPFDPGTFEFGSARDFAGQVVESPYPQLRVERPAAEGASTQHSSYYLVTTGKRGAATEVEGLDGELVRLEGSLIWRAGQTMIEIVPGSVRRTDGPPALVGAATGPAPEDLGMVTLRGEIVDSKCYLGVMKPGRGKPHRACASLCIRGGIPPVLAIRREEGELLHMLLVDEDGGPVNARVLDRVGEPVEVSGRLVRHGDGLLVLATDPSTITRASEES